MCIALNLRKAETIMKLSIFTISLISPLLLLATIQPKEFQVYHAANLGKQSHKMATILSITEFNARKTYREGKTKDQYYFQNSPFHKGEWVRMNEEQFVEKRVESTYNEYTNYKAIYTPLFNALGFVPGRSQIKKFSEATAIQIGNLLGKKVNSKSELLEIFSSEDYYQLLDKENYSTFIKYMNKLNGDEYTVEDIKNSSVVLSYQQNLSLEEIKQKIKKSSPRITSTLTNRKKKKNKSKDLDYKLKKDIQEVSSYYDLFLGIATITKMDSKTIQKVSTAKKITQSIMSFNSNQFQSLSTISQLAQMTNTFGMAMTLMSGSFGSDPSAAMFSEILKQLNIIRQEMHDRFDKVDKELAKIISQNIFNRRHLQTQIERLNNHIENYYEKNRNMENSKNLKDITSTWEVIDGKLNRCIKQSKSVEDGKVCLDIISNDMLNLVAKKLPFYIHSNVQDPNVPFIQKVDDIYRTIALNLYENENEAYKLVNNSHISDLEYLYLINDRALNLLNKWPELNQKKKFNTSMTTRMMIDLMLSKATNELTEFEQYQINFDKALKDTNQFFYSDKPSSLEFYTNVFTEQYNKLSYLKEVYNSYKETLKNYNRSTTDISLPPSIEGLSFDLNSIENSLDSYIPLRIKERFPEKDGGIKNMSIACSKGTDESDYTKNAFKTLRTQPSDNNIVRENMQIISDFGFSYPANKKNILSVYSDRYGYNSIINSIIPKEFLLNEVLATQNNRHQYFDICLKKMDWKVAKSYFPNHPAFYGCHHWILLI